jgi:hypothetical protein
MTLASTGNLLIGTTTDAGYKLDVNGQIRASATSAITLLTLSGNGNNITTAYLSNTDTGSTARGNYEIATDSANVLFFATSSTNTSSALGGRASTGGIFTSSGNTAGGLAFLARNASGYITFHTGGSTERLRIAANGAATFSSSVTAGSRIVSYSTTYGLFHTDSSSYNTYLDTRYISADNGYLLETGKNGANAVPYLALGTADTERMRITSGGNVLVGTTTDNGSKLQVNGITKTNGISLAKTSFSSSTTMTDAFFSWSFGGAIGQTLTLYSSSGHTNMHFIKNESAVPLTISGTIMTLTSGAPASSILLAGYKTIQIISFGSSTWYIMYQTT